MKKSTLTALTFALASGSVFAAERNGLDTDLVYGSQPVVAAMSAPAEREIGARHDFDSDILLGGNRVPSSPGEAPAPAVTLENGAFTLRYSMDTLLSDITYQVQVSTDLETWDPVVDELESVTNYHQTRRAGVPSGSHPLLFLRLAITRP